MNVTMIGVGLGAAAIGFLLLIGFIWADRKPFRLGGTYLVQCRFCKDVYEIENPTVQELKDHSELFRIVHQRCLQTRTGP